MNPPVSIAPTGSAGGGRVPVWVPSLLLCLSILPGCSPRLAEVDRATAEGRFLHGNGSEPQSLDPHILSGSPEARIVLSLLEGLVAHHPTDSKTPAPGVALRWEHSEDGLSWRFHLRPEARWSNGDPVTAADFVFSWRRAVTPEMACPYADWFYMIEGAEDYHRGREDDFSTVGVRAEGAHELVLRLLHPVPELPFLLQHHSFLPVHGPTILAHGRVADRASGWTRPGSFVGNGPFRLREWQVNHRIRVEPNPYYWDRERVGLSAIDFLPIENLFTEERAFRAGQLHLTSTVPSTKVPYYRERRPEVLRLDPFLGIYHFRINTTRKPLDDLRVRQALTFAIDRDLIVRRITRAGESPATAYTPPGIPGYEPPVRDLYDPERARALLAEAGFPGGEGFPQLDFLFNTSENHRLIAEAVQQMWMRELGVRIRLLNQEWKVYLQSQTRMDYDISRAGWVGNLYPMAFLHNFLTDGGNNFTGWSHPEYDRLIAQARSLADPGERNRLISQAEGVLLDHLPVIPIYWYTQAFLIHPHLHGWAPKLNDLRPYAYVSLQP